MLSRLKIVIFIWSGIFFLLIARLFFWQIVKGNQFSQKGQLQYQNQKSLGALRGSILAEDGSWLATNADSWILWARPSEFRETKRTIANKLAPLVVEAKEDSSSFDEAVRLEGLLSKEASWISLKTRISTEIKKNIEALRIVGIGFDLEEARIYPEASIAAQVLGFLGKDDAGESKGYFGLEGYYDLVLAGKPGFIKRESDARGIPILLGKSNEVASIEGVDLITTISKPTQLIIEEKLKNAIEIYGARSGSVVVIKPSDGSILAMASSPSYDPAKYWEGKNEFFKNPVISDSFEPGSIFKPIVMAMALDAKVIKPDTKCDICDKAFKIDKYEIKTWNNEYHPDSTMTDVIVHSDNVGMVFVGNKLGKEKFYDYLIKFGFGSLTGIDLQGEEKATLRAKNDWNIVDLATATFGQGIAVTPIQVIRAVAAIANNGLMAKPFVVSTIKKDGFTQEFKTLKETRVISSEASEAIKEMMVKAVEAGEAKWAVPKGFKIAGKTGTAQIPVSGHYDSEKTIASFIGFAPADNPKFVMLVTLSEPKTSQWGSETAAPLWFDIAKDMFPILGIYPEN